MDMRGFFKVAACCGIFLYLTACTKKNKTDEADESVTPPTTETPTEAPGDEPPASNRDSPNADNPAATVPEREEPDPVFIGPKTFHILYMTGNSPERRNLIYANRSADKPWTPTLIAASTDSVQLFGRASLQLDETAPVISFVKHVANKLERPRLEFSLAEYRTRDQSFYRHTLLTGDRPETSTITGTTSFSKHGKFAVAVLSQVSGLHTTTAIDLKKHDTIAKTSESSDISVTDVAIATDRTGRAMIAYIKDRHLTVQGSTNTSEATKIDIANCSAVQFVAIKSAPKGMTHILHTCTYNHTNREPVDDPTDEQSNDHDCRLGLSSGTSMSAMTTVELAVIDSNQACGQFTADRPSLAVDSLGNVHVAFRFRENTDTGWNIGYIAVKSGGASPVKKVDATNAPVGFAHVAVDGKNYPHLCWMNANKLMIATSDDNGHLRTEAVTFTEDQGVPLTLADFTVSGGL